MGYKENRHVNTQKYAKAMKKKHTAVVSDDKIEAKLKRRRKDEGV